LGFFASLGRSFVKGVDCPVGEVLIYILNKKFPLFFTPFIFDFYPPPIFHWEQAAPNRYRVRSHCRNMQLGLQNMELGKEGHPSQGFSTPYFSSAPTHPGCTISV